MPKIPEEKRRGCLFCQTGYEGRTAVIVEMQWPGAKARAVKAAKRRSRQGVKRLEMETLLPGYVFFEMDESFQPAMPHPDGVIRILTTIGGDWKLTGQDDAFARWVMQHEGRIEASRAHIVGERVVIHEGPLKDMEGSIIRIDKRNSNALVELQVGGQQVRTWLPFEIVEEQNISYYIDEE